MRADTGHTQTTPHTLFSLSFVSFFLESLFKFWVCLLFSLSGPCSHSRYTHTSLEPTPWWWWCHLLEDSSAVYAWAVIAAAIKLQPCGCVSMVRKCLSIFIDVCSDVFQSCHCCVLFFLRQMIIKGNPCLDPPGLVWVVIWKRILSRQEAACVSTIFLKPEHLKRTFVNIWKARIISRIISHLCFSSWTPLKEPHTIHHYV